MTITMTLPQIRQGFLKDCKDLLTVYQTTRRLNHRYIHVDEVKKEHQGRLFRRWGWLVAEMNHRVVGEIIFRTEKNPMLGTVGVINSIDVDVRFQKQGIGRTLVKGAEKAFKNRGVMQIVTDTPPEAYNFWMKLGYFARQALLVLEADVSSMKTDRSRSLVVKPIKEFYHIPVSMKYSNLSPAGHLSRIAALVIDGDMQGGAFEFYRKDTLVGSGAIAKMNNSTVTFVADVIKGNDELMRRVVSKIATIAIKTRAKTVRTIIQKTQWEKYEGIADWRVEDSSLTPITRLL